jgi:hypothetical protein
MLSPEEAVVDGGVVHFSSCENEMREEKNAFSERGLM